MEGRYDYVWRVHQIEAAAAAAAAGHITLIAFSWCCSVPD
jgi:hypothetical protein